MKRDHPRACGEKVRSVGHGVVDIGSPPRVRGKAYAVISTQFNSRITPARAGKSRGFRPIHGGHEDHPRACGEKKWLLGPQPCAGGSPPRVRGKVGVCHFFEHFPGITPARAGKRARRCTSCCGCRDHPRACGEKLYCFKLRIPAKGSPPRVRGKADYYAMRRTGKGITPARAGKSSFRYKAIEILGDHPRACGEKTKRIPILSHCFQVKGSFSFSFS